MGYDYIPPGYELVKNKLVKVSKERELMPKPYQVIEQLKAQIRVLEQRVNSDELDGLARALKVEKKRYAVMEKSANIANAKVSELEATVAEQTKTIRELDDKYRILKGSERVKRGEAPPPISPSMEELASVKKELDEAKRTILAMKEDHKEKHPKTSPKKKG